MKEFERLRIASDVEEEEILFSTSLPQGEDIQVTTLSGQEESSEEEQTTTTTIEEEKSTTADITTPATTTTTSEPETRRSFAPNQNARLVAATHVRFPQEDVRFPQENESEGRHSIAFGPQLPVSHQDPQLPQGSTDSQEQQGPQLPEEKQPVQLSKGPELPEGTISFQPRHPDPILQVFVSTVLLDVDDAKVSRAYSIAHHLMAK